MNANTPSAPILAKGRKARKARAAVSAPAPVAPAPAPAELAPAPAPFRLARLPEIPARAAAQVTEAHKAAVAAGLPEIAEVSLNAIRSAAGRLATASADSGRGSVSYRGGREAVGKFEWEDACKAAGASSYTLATLRAGAALLKAAADYRKATAV